MSAISSYNSTLQLLEGESVQARTHNHNVLLAVASHVSHGTGVAFGIEFLFPQHLPGLRIKRAEALVVGAGDKDSRRR